MINLSKIIINNILDEYLFSLEVVDKFFSDCFYYLRSERMNSVDKVNLIISKNRHYHVNINIKKKSTFLFPILNHSEKNSQRNGSFK